MNFLRLKNDTFQCLQPESEPPYFACSQSRLWDLTTSGARADQKSGGYATLVNRDPWFTNTE